MVNSPRSAEGTVFLLDDEPDMLKALTRLLKAEGHTVSAFTSAKAFLESYQPQAHGCLVLDVAMPEIDGLELQRCLTRSGVLLPIVFLTGHGDIPMSVQAIKAGAEDFLTKRAPKDDLLQAIARAVERDARERRERDRTRAVKRQFDQLSAREMEVLRHVMTGSINKEIAAELGINERTVKLHRTSITRKLEVRSVAELTRLVEEAGIFKV